MMKNLVFSLKSHAWTFILIAVLQLSIIRRPHQIWQVKKGNPNGRKKEEKLLLFSDVINMHIKSQRFH